jgi:hypothetical protein
MDIGIVRRVIQVALQPAPTPTIIDEESDFDEADSEIEER